MNADKSEKLKKKFEAALKELISANEQMRKFDEKKEGNFIEIYNRLKEARKDFIKKSSKYLKSRGKFPKVVE
jgi:hypothetical protein